MTCPECQSTESQITETRRNKKQGIIRRRRECLRCGHRYTTEERMVKEPDSQQQGTNAEILNNL